MNDDDGCSNKFGAAIPKDSTENLLVLRMILILRKGWSTSVYDMLMNKEKTIVPKESLLWVLQHSDEPDDTKLWKLAILLCGIAEVPNATSKSGAAGGAGGSTGWSSSRMTCTDGAGDVVCGQEFLVENGVFSINVMTKLWQIVDLICI